MRSWHRDIVRQVQSARFDLTLAWLALAAFLIGGCTARGQDAEALSALALAKAKRDREATSCFTDSPLNAERTSSSSSPNQVRTSGADGPGSMVTHTMPCRSSQRSSARPADGHASVENSCGWETDRRLPSRS